MELEIPKPDWLYLLQPEQRAWREKQFLKGRNPDNDIEMKLREAGEWPAAEAAWRRHETSNGFKCPACDGEDFAVDVAKADSGELMAAKVVCNDCGDTSENIPLAQIVSR